MSGPFSASKVFWSSLGSSKSLIGNQNKEAQRIRNVIFALAGSLFAVGVVNASPFHRSCRRIVRMCIAGSQALLDKA